ncbi:replication protein A 32 kDa subunit A-like isoform X2 [Salvia splendens]|uniref:replication protein A 32 kDa subunit A-like isoform X2 n=1 Tax=Salvia splendens TaxID=180675 RepID=UPI001C26E401|nr:replication protein A 32 kDa subunit A-like isoform X2 [Salvia splendens]
MYGNSEFDGSAAFSGGGFMPSQATQTADPSFSPAKNRDAQGLLPLTVKQIREAFQASDDKANFLIDGVSVNNVKLVGLVFEKTERVTDVSFTLDDGTGRIDCHRWVQEVVDTKEMELLSNGTYVKVHGHLKGFQGKKQLIVYSVRSVTDYNEIPNHFAECIYVHCYNTRTRMQDAPQVTGQMPNLSVNTPSKGYQPTSSNHLQFSAQHNVDAIRGIDKLVLNYMQQPSCIGKESGVHRAELARQLNVPEHKILEAIASLESEGLVYSTVDEFHYKSTANG